MIALFLWTVQIFKFLSVGKSLIFTKFKLDSALWYEVAVCIQLGVLVWINGLYEPGIWNDLLIF